MRADHLTITLLLALLSCNHMVRAEEKGMIGIDFGSTLRNRIPGISLGYDIGSGWSIEVRSGMRIKHLFEISEEERCHYDETGMSDFMNAESTGQHICRIALKHWKDIAFDGSFVSGGLSLKTDGTADLTAGAGYAASIFKGIGAYISYEMLLLQTYRSGISGNEMTIGIYYLF